MSRRPRILEFIQGESDDAADGALASALPHVDATLQLDLVSILLERGRTDGLAALMEHFDQVSYAAQMRIVSGSAMLFAALRGAIRSPDHQCRRNALEVIRRSENPRLAYLAALAIHDGASRIRAEAAQALLDLSRRHIETHAQTTALLRETAEGESGLAESTVATVRLAAEERKFLLDAIREALGSFESHHRPEVLEAAMLFADEMEDLLFGGGSFVRGKLTRAVIDILGDRLQPCFAPLVYVTLPHADLRRRIIPLLSSCRDAAFFAEFIRLRWLHADPRIARHLVHVRSLEWLRDGFEPAFALPADVAPLAPDWLMKLGVPVEQKAVVLSHFLDIANPEANRAACWAMTRIDTPTSSLILHDALEHEDLCVRAVARAETEHRRKKSQRPARASRKDRPADWSHLLESARLTEEFEDFWLHFERIPPLLARSAGRRALEFVPGLASGLQAKFVDASPADRIRAIRLVMALDLPQRLSRELFNLCNDRVAEVRATAVRALGFIADPTSRRILERAVLHDVPAVQVQAVEALEQAGAAKHAAALHPLLESPHADVRGGAVRVLLKLHSPKAAQALVAMLHDERMEHRAGALWVIDQLHLTAAASRLADVAEKDPDPRVARAAVQLLKRLARGRAGDGVSDSGCGSETGAAKGSGETVQNAVRIPVTAPREGAEEFAP